jgi:circadian clock protein KaiB
MSKDQALDRSHLSLVPSGDEEPPHADGSYRFTLYVAGDTPKSLAAIANLRKLCELHLAGRHSIEVVDLMKNPELAAAHQILAVPTLIRRLPAPIKRVIGSLADVEKVLVGLELRSDRP